MAVCETCWTAASRDAAILGGSVVDHYRRRIESGDMPDHAKPKEGGDGDE